MSRNSSILTALCRSGRMLDVKPAAPRGPVDRPVEVQFLGRALAGEAAQAAKRDLDVAGAELAVAVEVAELALLPHLDRPAVAPRPADAHALGIVAAMAERGGAAGTDPLVAALVAPLLLGQPVLQRLHDLVPGAEALDRLHLLGRQIGLGDQAQPFFGNFGAESPRRSATSPLNTSANTRSNRSSWLSS